MKMCPLLLAVTVFVFSIVCMTCNSLDQTVHKFKIQEDDVYGRTFRVKVVANSSNSAVCLSDFLSLTIDSGEISVKWKGFSFSSQKLQNLAAGLSPATLRLGGTQADFLTFEPNAKKDDQAITVNRDEEDFSFLDSGLWWDYLDNELVLLKNISNFTMTGEEWDSITNFTEKVGWDIMFDFNLFKFRDWQKGLWDPSNAELLLNYSASRGIKLPAFQLGNEPNSFKHNFNLSIAAQTLLSNLRVLRETIGKYPQYSNSCIYGPEVTSVSRHPSARGYMDKFLMAGPHKVVDAISWHHYYLNGRTATVEQFMDPKVLDGMKKELQVAQDLTGQFPPVLPLRITETSSCYGGGAPGISDRFVAGFMWLDKLGLCAQAGVTAVHRQTFFRGNYALISRKLDPNPDYYLSLLYKRLILGPVLNASFEPAISHLRVYAHCVRRDFYKYPKGAIVLYYLNLRPSDITLSLSQFEGHMLDLFLLTPGDEAGPTSKLVKLNGETLLMQGPDLPPVNPKPHQGDVEVAAQSFGFIVVPDAQVDVCS